MNHYKPALHVRAAAQPGHANGVMCSVTDQHKAYAAAQPGHANGVMCSVTDQHEAYFFSPG